MLACKKGRFEVGKILVERFPRCITWTNKQGVDAVSQTAVLSSYVSLIMLLQLSLACENQASTPLIPLLLSNPDHPASVHSRDHNGDTPLHHASAAGSLKALRILLSAGADPMAKNAYDWTPLAYSQTVAAEVYFKNLVAEFERRKIEGARGIQGRQEEQMKKKGAGVRLVTGDDDGVPVRPSQDTARLEWSPVESRGAFAPDVGRSGSWTELTGTRTRALSGE